jgi:2-keto-3-deoxy-L-rhamnonate aldolase RhmA
VPGIDGTFIGPYDLSMSLGVPGQLNHPDVVNAKKKVLEATLRKGLAAGIHFVHPDTAINDCKLAIEEGYRFIAVGTDILFLGDSARMLQSDIKNILS